MSYITFNPNEIVYIRGIGYATLLNCGSRASISQKIEAQPIKKQSIYFDPDLFNSDADSNNSKKSQSKSDEEKVEVKPVEVIEPKKIEEVNVPKPQKLLQDQAINIIQAKLQGTNAMIYTSDKNLTKTIFIGIKSMLINHKEQIIIQVEISKTIDTLRKAIFQQLGEQIANYYNIKLFATNPMLSELSVHTKTIHQCLIKDNDKLILTADFAFGLKALPTNLNCKWKITLNNNTLTSAAKPQNVPIPLPPPPPVQLITEIKAEGEPKVQQKIEEIKQQIPVPPLITEIPVIIPIQEKPVVHQHTTYLSQCNIQLTTGRKYWQFKAQKLPTEDSDLIIGICSPSPSPKHPDTLQSCSHAWGYYPVSGKKNQLIFDSQGNLIQQDVQNYGYAVKQNDIIGILVNIRGRLATITFYKNSISCGQAFCINLAELNSKTLVPFVSIGGESQVTLDSKAQLPLDSFRKK